jgi:hypothetical protein
MDAKDPGFWRYYSKKMVGQDYKNLSDNILNGELYYV